MRALLLIMISVVVVTATTSRAEHSSAPGAIAIRGIGPGPNLPAQMNAGLVIANTDAEGPYGQPQFGSPDSGAQMPMSGSNLPDLSALQSMMPKF